LKHSTISSPNRMISVYFACARRSAARAQIVRESREQREEVVACLSMAVAAVEVFVNVYFRILVDKPGKGKERKMLLQDLDPDRSRGPMSLYAKLCNWPPKILGKSLQWQKGPAAAFNSLRIKRNELMHFVSSYETHSVGNVRFVGLADTSVFDDLQPTEALDAVRTAEEMLEHVFRLAEMPEREIPGALHHWTGKPPAVQ